MDGLKTEPVVTEDEAITPRVTLNILLQQCEHALEQRLAKRFSTREALKALEIRAAKLAQVGDGPDFDEEFAKVVTTGNAVFEMVIAETNAARA